MLGKKMESVKKLAKKVKVIRAGAGSRQSSTCRECLLNEYDDESSSVKTPTGTLALYVGEERQRFIVPTSFLSHPLFKMLLEKVYEEFGFQQRNGLIIPCTVSTFQEVVSVVESYHGQFDIERLVEEFNS